MEKAFITGINGQDGSYLAEHLLASGYEVGGLVRRSSVAENQTYRINHIEKDIKTYYGDLIDPTSIEKALKDFKPDNVMYQKWIETYASNEYQDVCKNVSQLIDNSFLIRLGNNYKDTYKWVQANKIFNKATLLEVDFWNMALK